MFNKIYILITLSLFHFFTFSLCARELLWNRDFEIGTTDYWSIGPGEISRFEIEEQSVFNGKYSAVISIPKGVISTAYIYQGSSVTPNTIYTASGYFYDTDFDYEVAYSWIEIYWLDVNRSTISFDKSLSSTLNSTNWQFLTTGRVQSPPNANFAKFCIVINKINVSEFAKKIYIDDLSFRKIEEVQLGRIPEPKNYPNPFNPRPPKLQKTEIVIPEQIGTENLEIKIYSISGDKINTIYSSIWDGKDSNGEFVQPGVYFYIIRTNKGHAKGKMTVIK